ncbi:hypothetical protein J4Q44_G00031530 [Coregonus suidteri]|uniref:Uncharacterized protein n=1 Tax=Coregonus suidteri TaxID=861788 RepID=A0AAN8MB00_9TELE
MQEEAQGREGVRHCATSCFVNRILQPFGVRLGTVGPKDEGAKGEKRLGGGTVVEEGRTLAKGNACAGKRSVVTSLLLCGRTVAGRVTGRRSTKKPGCLWTAYLWKRYTKWRDITIKIEPLCG